MSDDTSKVDTVEIPPPGPAPRVLGQEAGSARVQVDLAALSHPGLVRRANEDHYLVLRFGRTLETVLTSLPSDQLPPRFEEVGYGLLVADGIGGAAAGELASRTAISTLVSLVLHTPDWVLSDELPQTEQVLRRMAERFRRIDSALREEAGGAPDLAGMGTTMTLACSLGASVVLGHVGDSRAYLLHGGALHQLTRDHTFVQALVDQGQLSAEEAARHRLRHVLTGALGGWARSWEGDFQRAWLADGDQLLLCTDGLTGMVDDAAIAAVLRGASSSEEACQALVAAALEKGGRDNVTVALARYRFPG
jgi:protein phosphatase